MTEKRKDSTEAREKKYDKMRNTNLKEQNIYKCWLKAPVPTDVSLKEPKHAQCKMQDDMREVV